MKQQQKDVFWAAMVLRSKQVGSFFFFFFFLLVFCLCRGREAMPGGSSNTRVTRKFTYRNGM